MLSAQMPVGGTVYPVLLHRKNGQVMAFLNACPHQYLPLDFQGPNILSADGTLLMCSMHGAKFTIDDGQCVEGPCMGSCLTRISVVAAGPDCITLEAVLW